jgi:alkylated DNA repair dioxygenase AlkB
MTVLAGPAVDHDVAFERVWLDRTSWVDVARGWLAGADGLHQTLLEQVRWRTSRLWRYDHWVEEPRLYGSARVDGRPVHPVLPELYRTLERRYHVPFGDVALAQYRTGRDSVAFHRDRELRWLDDTLIAVLTLGQRRPWQLRPRKNRFAHDAPNHGATHDISPASGDLLVMGGRAQADWEHSVPKVAAAVGPRISLQWRWTSHRGRPVVGGNYRDPRNYSR